MLPASTNNPVSKLVIHSELSATSVTIHGTSKDIASAVLAAIPPSDKDVETYNEEIDK